VVKRGERLEAELTELEVAAGVQQVDFELGTARGAVLRTTAG
jgi:hypothetical protein